MKVKELFEYQLNPVDDMIIEDTELAKLIDKEISSPITKSIEEIKAKVIKAFVPKLKAWALSSLPNAKKLGDEHSIRVQKYFNHPEVAAKQLVNAILSKKFA